MHEWVRTHSLRPTKAVLIYRRTGHLRAVQILLGNSKIESTVGYLGIEVDDAIEIAEKIHITAGSPPRADLVGERPDGAVHLKRMAAIGTEHLLFPTVVGVGA